MRIKDAQHDKDITCQINFTIELVFIFWKIYYNTPKFESSIQTWHQIWKDNESKNLIKMVLNIIYILYSKK